MHTYGVALSLCSSESPDRRRLGCHLLGRLMWHSLIEREHAVAVLEDRVFCENDPGVLVAAITSMGELGDPQGLQSVMVRAEHRAVDVRTAVACALPSLMGSPPDPDAMAVLRGLTRDPVATVRDWATFALGHELSADDDATRAALLDRLDDPDPAVSGEALIVLARRHDQRALRKVLEQLRHLVIGSYVIDAAEELADPEALPLLLDLRDQADVMGVDLARLDQAIASCSGRGDPKPVDHSHHPAAGWPGRN